MERILITGGAGFIGSHLADELLKLGYHVRILDNLCEQVHGPERRRPSYLDPEVELLIGDVRDREAVQRALEGVDAVYHFAAAVGVGQSMYEIEKYTSINNLGTAVLLEALSRRPAGRLIVASSMSIYGEGLYRAADGSLLSGTERSVDQLKAGIWELYAPEGGLLAPVPTPEAKLPALASVYALSKYDQERLCLLVGQAYGIPTVALRFFNVFGPRQALSNPYTGVLAIFASRYLNGKAPLVYEDGEQRRDFVSVYDVVQACRLALVVPEAAGQVFNVGSGVQSTVLEVAASMAQALGGEQPEPVVAGKYRVGDIRHCFADITRAREVLGYRPRFDLAGALPELAQWVAGQSAADGFEQAHSQLTARGLTL